MRRLVTGMGFVLLVGGAALVQAMDEMPHGDLALDCEKCHNPQRWVPVGKPPGFDHKTTGFALESAHAQASCRACHRALVFNQVAVSCADCHRDAHRGELGRRCETCHTPTTWTNQREMAKAHSKTRFPLLASHASLDCTACHRNQKPYQFANTPAECGVCHRETYERTTNPNHQASGFSRRCEDCHIVTSPTWRGARAGHSASFPLSGGHAGVACARCHTQGTNVAPSRSCVTCHQKDYAATSSPSHVAGGFPTTCEACHTINGWRPATFDHSRARFPLTGAHTRVDCARCHQNGRYTGTPSDCYACHQQSYASTSNPNHAASGFPTQCQNCHTTTAWRPASFDHDGRYFPIYSGKHRGKWSSCSDCHVSAGNYKAFECIFCHEHSNRSEVDRDHRGVGGYAYQSAACYRCHNRGVADDARGGSERLR